MGLTGPVEIWDGTRAFPRMCSIVQAASGLTVQENDEVSARFVKCRPFVMCAEAASGGVRGGLPGRREMARPPVYPSTAHRPAAFQRGRAGSFPHEASDDPAEGT